MPKWMTTVDTLKPGAAFVLAMALAVFVIIASLSIAIPVVWYLASPSRAQQHLDALKSWMSEHNAAVMAVLFLVFVSC